MNLKSKIENLRIQREASLIASKEMKYLLDNFILSENNYKVIKKSYVDFLESYIDLGIELDSIAVEENIYIM